MKKLAPLLILLVSFLMLPDAVYAHARRQLPFLKINGMYSDMYPVTMPALSIFTLPQDTGPQKYLVNQAITLEIDPSRLPAPTGAITERKFTWNFGDWTVAEGLQNTHTYSKPGSYLLTIHVTSLENKKPQLLDSLLLNILPNTFYMLPKASISVGGWTSSDPQTDILETSFDKELTFDGTKSQSSSEIVTYSWDFGDQQSAEGAKVTHRYTPDTDTVLPVLMVKNADGFIAAAYVQINNKRGVQNQSGIKNSVQGSILAGTAALIGILLGVFLFIKYRSKTSP